jgi:hypothetical protein
MSKTVSARIPTILHEELRDRCNLVGESINDFIIACIEVGLHSTTEFDFGEELISELDDQKSKFEKSKTQV